MDQRNATGGRSRAPITAKDGWHSYTSDHVTVLAAHARYFRFALKNAPLSNAGRNVAHA